MKNSHAILVRPVTLASLDPPASLTCPDSLNPMDDTPDAMCPFQSLGFERTSHTYVSPDTTRPSLTADAATATKKPRRPKKAELAPDDAVEPPAEGGYMPLGKTPDGSFAAWSNAAKRVYVFNEKELMNRSKLMSLADLDWLRENHGGLAVRWEEAGNTLQRRCLAAGLYSKGKERGLGVWIDGDDLIVNSACCYNGSTGKPVPRVNDNHVYLELGSLGAEPGQAVGTAQDGCLLEGAFNSFNWENGITDARLIFGWTLLAPFAAAVDHRPHTFVFSEVGGAGKSYLKKLQTMLLGERAMRGSATTEAGLRQNINSGAFLGDEMGKDASERVQAVFELLKVGFDGDKMQKGTDGDQKGRSFDVRFSACLYGVNVPEMNDQVRGRFLVAKLLKFEVEHDEKGRPIESDLPQHPLAPTPENEEKLRELGRRMFARMLKRWPEYLQSISHIRRALKASSRFLDTFTPLIAAVYTATHDTPLDSTTSAALYVNEFDLESEKDRIANVGQIGIEFKNAFDSIVYDFGGIAGKCRLDVVIGHASYEHQKGVLRQALKKVGIHVRAKKGAILNDDGSLDHEICIQCPITDAFRGLFKGGQFANGDHKALIVSIPGASPHESATNDVRYGLKPSKYLTVPFEQPSRDDMPPLNGSTQPDAPAKPRIQDRSHLPAARLVSLNWFLAEVEPGDVFAIHDNTTSPTPELMLAQRVEQDESVICISYDDRDRSTATAMAVDQGSYAALGNACPEFWLHKPAPTASERNSIQERWKEKAAA